MQVIRSALLMVLLSGCAAAGTKVTEQQAQQFRVGQSTYSQVVGALGAPTTTTVASNGIRTAVYSYAAVRAQPQNFIPYIGPLVSGYDAQKSVVTFTFDQSGILTGTTSAQTGVGTGANLAAGSNAANAPYQAPR
jgi:outer membrane protein assembly factor BamE (lipoprotein component of BamABCDE complex)